MNSSFASPRRRTTASIAGRLSASIDRMARAFYVAAWIAAAVCGARGQGATAVFSGPTNAVAAGERVSVWLSYLNDSQTELTRSFPARIEGRMLTDQQTNSVELELRGDSEAGDAIIAPGRFARREYQLTVPDSLEGHVRIEVRFMGVHRIAMEVRKPDAAEPGAGVSPDRTTMDRKERAERLNASDPIPFFQAHFFPHEPFYFIAGTETPNAKFQISFKYQLLTGEGRIAARNPWTTNFYLGYTQTSLWDWNEPSAPFFDSSYRPEFLYWMPQVDRGEWAEWFRLDLQGGFQHESNGRDGASSRSLNIAYFKPTFALGKPDRLQLTLSPRAWVYVGNLGDNPDIKDYRGYVELRAVVGWAKHAQLAALGRVGDDLDRGSVQLDLTYPLWKVPVVRSSLFFHVQYFTGYGESLLLYNERDSSLRAGFSMFR